MKVEFAEEPKPALAEAEVIRRAQHGDASAFECLYRSHSRQVFGLCLRITRNTNDAEDLTQQVFLQVFRKVGLFRGDSSFSTWLHRVTVNAALMWVRRKKVTEISMDDLDRSDPDGDIHREPGAHDASLLGVPDRLNLMRAIRKLPAGSKRIFWLHDIMGYDHAEIGKLIGCSSGCSKSQTHKARRRLRCLLQGKPRPGEPDSVPA
jgi:RNA polymerase sigma-70 factor (ECF subfamily)